MLAGQSGSASRTEPLAHQLQHRLKAEVLHNFPRLPRHLPDPAPQVLAAHSASTRAST